MPRHAKHKADPPKARTPPRESEEDRLIRTGMAICFARDMKQEAPQREELEAILMDEGANAPPTTLPADLRHRFADLGRQDPRPFMERIKHSCHKLLPLCQTQEEKRLVEQMMTTLADLELVLAVRRYGGRPRGTRHKVKPDQIEAIRRWKAGDRSLVHSSSVADVAKKLGLSRQTVYTILEGIRLEGIRLEGQKDCDEEREV